MSKIYDVIVLGAGPAGLAAGLYAGRSRLSVLIIEKGQDGVQIAITDEIENYPGQIVEGESGPSLIARMTEQAAKFGAERVSDTIKEVELNGDVKVLKSEKSRVSGKERDHRYRRSRKTDRMQGRSRIYGQGCFLLALPVMPTSLRTLKYT